MLNSATDPGKAHKGKQISGNVRYLSVADWLPGYYPPSRRRQRIIASFKLTSEEILNLLQRDFAPPVPASSLVLRVLLPNKRQETVNQM